MKRYTESHEWAEVKEGKARIGISQYAQSELGEIVYVSLPSIGAEVKAEEESAVLESTKTASDVYSPLSGKVRAVNTKVIDNPALLNASPEDGGWLFEVEATNPKEWEALLSKENYLEMVGSS